MAGGLAARFYPTPVTTAAATPFERVDQKVLSELADAAGRALVQISR